MFLLFLVSEGLLFVSFFWTSFHSLCSPTLGICFTNCFYFLFLCLSSSIFLSQIFIDSSFSKRFPLNLCLHERNGQRNLIQIVSWFLIFILFSFIFIFSLAFFMCLSFTNYDGHWLLFHGIRMKPKKSFRKMKGKNGILLFAKDAYNKGFER